MNPQRSSALCSLAEIRPWRRTKNPAVASHEKDHCQKQRRAHHVRSGLTQKSARATERSALRPKYGHRQPHLPGPKGANGRHSSILASLYRAESSEVASFVGRSRTPAGGDYNRIRRFGCEGQSWHFVSPAAHFQELQPGTEVAVLRFAPRQCHEPEQVCHSFAHHAKRSKSVCSNPRVGHEVCNGIPFCKSANPQCVRRKFCGTHHE